MTGSDIVWNGDGAPQPDRARVGKTGGGKRAGKMDGLPIRRWDIPGGEGGGVRRLGKVATILRFPRVHGLRVRLRLRGKRLEGLPVSFLALLEVRHAVERFGTRPGLDRRTTPVVVDQPHGSVEFLLDLLAEEIPDRGKVPRGGRPGDHPASANRIKWRRRGLVRHVKLTEPGIRGGGNHLPGVRGILDGKFHVRLAGAEPHFTDEDIGHGYLVGALDYEVEGARPNFWKDRVQCAISHPGQPCFGR